MRKIGGLLTIVLSTGGLAMAATAPEMGNETINYTYDELGRLTGSTTTGGPNNTRTTGTCFDRAGNRSRYDVAKSTPAPCPTPTP